MMDTNFFVKCNILETYIMFSFQPPRVTRITTFKQFHRVYGAQLDSCRTLVRANATIGQSAFDGRGLVKGQLVLLDALC